MNKKIVYLMSGTAHLPYLVASLYSLRRHWDGAVEVHAWPESIGYVRQISQDKRLWISCVEREKPLRYRRQNRQFMDKIRLMQSLESGVNLYFDADTMVVREIHTLFDVAEKFGFCATQFNNWESHNGVSKRRIKRLLDRDGINQQHVRTMLKKGHPSLNGGIFSCQPSSSVLETWINKTKIVQDIFIADETVLHIMLPEYSDSYEFKVAMGGSFNCSPKFRPENLTDSDIHIWHFHGDSNVRPNKSPKGIWLWWPVYSECLELNIGRIQDWIGEIRNKYLDKFNKRNETKPEEICFYCDRNAIEYHTKNEYHTKKCPLFEKETV